MKNAKQNIVKATNDIKLANASISKENKVYFIILYKKQTNIFKNINYFKELRGKV